MRARSALAILCQSALLGLPASASRADWIQTVGLGERPALLGGAFTAIADDHTAWYTNPAGAARFERPRLGANTRLLDTRPLYFRDATGEHETDRSTRQASVAPAPSVGGFYPLGSLDRPLPIPHAERLVLGLGFGAPYAITANWSDTGYHRYSSRNQSLFVLELAPMVAIRLHDRLFVGATLNWVTHEKLEIDAFLGDGFVGQGASFASGGAIAATATIDGEDDGDISLSTHDSAHLGVGRFDPDFRTASYTLGVLVRPTDDLRLGLVYRAETPVEFDGRIRLNLTPAATVGVLPVRSSTSALLELEMPRHLQGGLAWDVFDGRATWSFDLQWTNWSDAHGFGSRARVKLDPGLLVLPAGLAGALLPANPGARAAVGDAVRTLDLDYEMRDTLALRSGLELRLREDTSLLLGYAFDPSAMSRGRIDAITFSSDRHLLSLGLSHRQRRADGGGWSLTAGAQAIVYESRNVPEGRSRHMGGFAVYEDRDGAFASLNFASNRDPYTASRPGGAPITGRTELGGTILAVGLSFEAWF